MPSVLPVLPLFADIDGQPLEGASIYIGVANLDPTINPIQAYWDEGLTQPATQPVLTRGGYPLNGVNAGRLYVAVNDYSITVANRAGGVVFATTLTDVDGSSATQTLTNKTIVENAAVIGTNTNAAASTVYVFTANLTLTLPASPSAGDWVSVSNQSGTTTCVIGRNGNNIMGLAEDMTVDEQYAGFKLSYADATRGWVIL